MGLFDSVYVPCPGCGERAEFQSKAGECYMGQFELSNAPPPVLADIAGEDKKCQRCGAVFGVRVHQFAVVERR